MRGEIGEKMKKFKLRDTRKNDSKTFARWGMNYFGRNNREREISTTFLSWRTMLKLMKVRRKLSFIFVLERCFSRRSHATSSSRNEYCCTDESMNFLQENCNLLF